MKSNCLDVQINAICEIGPRQRNEDAIQVVTPSSDHESSKGTLCVIADGVSRSADGRLAAVSTVRAVAADYYATPETWSISQSLEKVLLAHNRWLRAQGQSLLSTCSCLVIAGRRYVIAHVGDCRVYRYRNQSLTQLTEEHVWDEPTMNHVLKRAMGLDQHLIVDFIEGDTQEQDIYILMSDGVWQLVHETELQNLLQTYGDDLDRWQEILRALILKRQPKDNYACIAVKVNHLPKYQFQDVLTRDKNLPIPLRLKVGQSFEGLTVQQILSDSASSLSYLVKDKAEVRWVMKTLPPKYRHQQDRSLETGLLTEEWIQKRLTAQYFPEVSANINRTHLYFLLRWYAGTTLEEALNQNITPLPISYFVGLSLHLTRAIGALHRMNIIHSDIKPANVHIGTDGKLRVLDMGLAYCAGLMPERTELVGTPSYIAPELYEGTPTNNRQTDIFAIGILLYWSLTNRYPYGEIEAFQHPSFGVPIPPSRYRPDIPQWFENIILKAIAVQPSQRFETTEEMQLALEQGESRPIAIRRHTPWAERSPMKTWRFIALLSLIVNLFLFYALLLT